MQLTGEVKAIAIDEPSRDREWTEVTVRLYGGAYGELKLRMPKHRARGYQLGRVVNVSVEIGKKSR